MNPEGQLRRDAAVHRTWEGLAVASALDILCLPAPGPDIFCLSLPPRPPLRDARRRAVTQHVRGSGGSGGGREPAVERAVRVGVGLPCAWVDDEAARRNQLNRRRDPDRQRLSMLIGEREKRRARLYHNQPITT